MTRVELSTIAVARTPYKDWAPHQPPEREAAAGAFRLVLDEAHVAGLHELGRFSHVVVLSFLDRREGPVEYRVRPPWAKGREVGLWASRSPNRPSPIGFSVVQILAIAGNVITTSPLDLLDGTPVLDLKPYIGSFDAHQDANDGWIEDLPDHRHLLQHLRGTVHDHGHEHEHEHDHGHDHEHEHEHD